MHEEPILLLWRVILCLSIPHSLLASNFWSVLRYLSATMSGGPLQGVCAHFIGEQARTYGLPWPRLNGITC